MKFPTFKIFLRTDQASGDKGVLYARITLNRKKKYISLNISIRSKDWDEKACIVRKSDAHWSDHNRLLQSYVARANNIIYEYSLRNQALTLDEFKKHFEIAYDTKSVYDFVDVEIIGKSTVAAHTLRAYKSQYAKLKAYRKELYFCDLDVSFVNDYERYLKIKLQNSHNTIVNAFKFLKIISKRAIELGFMEKNPFDNKKYAFKDADRDRLSLDELIRLDAIYEREDLDIKYKRVLRYFLLCCYTGLRFGDMRSLRYRDIDNGVISIKMSKTSNAVRIPVVDRAKKYIGECTSRDSLVFKSYVNEVTNRHLKDIMNIAGIHKSISFHCARHTFATVSLELGIPMELVSQLLGHTNVKITRIYAKYNDKIKTEELQKFDDI